MSDYILFSRRKKEKKIVPICSSLGSINIKKAEVLFPDVS